MVFRHLKIFMSDLIPTEDNPHPLLKIKGEERKSFVKKSILITVIFTVVIYVFPSYYFLESLTTQTSYFALDIFGFNPSYAPWSGAACSSGMKFVVMTRGATGV